MLGRTPSLLLGTDLVMRGAVSELAKLTRVLAAVIQRDSRLLLAQRPSHKRHGGLWEFPGGKLAIGEDHLAAARRELAG
jgi:8-oxo-dGTP pyrophosphatase MutT (NUDIX family)